MALFEIISWLFVVEIIGLVALPITAYLCRGLPDRGYSVSKIMGLLFLTYFSWILTYFGSGYSASVVFASLFMLAAASYAFYRKFGLTVSKSLAIKIEIFFIAVFFVFLIIRSYSPDNYGEVGEKFMDMAFINSISRSSTFPPMDPWFSGMPMNYYYFGYLLISDLAKLTGTMLPTGFNIANAVFFAISASAALGIGIGLLKKAKFALVVFAFVLFLGNLVGFVQLLVILFFPAYYKQFYVPDASLPERLSTFSQWPSVNVIPGSISETPYYVYLIGDLHPNLVSISFQLLILSVILSAFVAGKFTRIQAIILGLTAGFLYPLNTWDYPAYIIIILAVTFLTTRNVKVSILFSGTFLILSYIFYLPYHLSFQRISEVAVITSERTELVSYLLIFGVFIFMILYYLVSNNRSFKRDSPKWLAGFAALMIISFLIKFQLLIILVPMLFLACSGLVKEKAPEKRFIFLLILMGALLSLFAELFYIEDAISRFVYFRFNTIFKLYLQIWILWGIAASYAFYEMLKKKVMFIALILILMASVYPIFVTSSLSRGFSGTSTLDGERSIEAEHPYDYQAIEWLRNKNGTPVVLQAAGYSYGWNSYISAFTGLPTVLGWEWHEYQWRMNLTEINTRRSDVELAYTSQDYVKIKSIIDKYNISYIYIGPVERERYKITQVFGKEKDKFKLVFENPEIRIYEVQ